MLENWISGRKDWSLGQIEPDEVLYYLNGPAIFTRTLGLAKYIFFKTDENSVGEYYIAATITDHELNALKTGALSVRGALGKARCWIIQTDFDLNVQQYQEYKEKEIRSLLPKSGIPLITAFKSAPDSIHQSESMFSFKFFGSDMSEEGMPFSTFKGLIDGVYNISRTELVPPSLRKGRARDFIDYPIRQPEFASLLIAIDKPVIDAARLRTRPQTMKLDPNVIEKEAYERGRQFANQIEKTIDLAIANGITKTFAAENFKFLERIINILPSVDNDVSRMQFSSMSSGSNIFIEANVQEGDRIREHYIGMISHDMTVTGVVSGLLGSSKTFRPQQNVRSRSDMSARLGGIRLIGRKGRNSYWS